jgi:DNA-binding NarL/FixJ family response regulator
MSAGGRGAAVQGVQDDIIVIEPDRRVLIVDDHRSFAEALAFAIEAQEGLTCVAIAATAAEGFTAATRTRPDIVLVDMRLPDASGPVLVTKLHQFLPDLAIIALTAYADAASVSAAAQSGVCAFLRKECSVQEILATLRTAGEGPMMVDAATLGAMTQVALEPQRRTVEVDGIRLTPREHEVLDLLAQAFDVRGVARRLGVSIHTVRGYVKSILAKFDAHTQLEAVVKARRLGVLADAPAGPHPIDHRFRVTTSLAG